MKQKWKMDIDGASVALNESFCNENSVFEF